MPHVLFPHQRRALRMIRDNPRPALFMQMRLGKTPVIIRWARRMTPARTRRVLIVGPLSVLDDWRVELQREGILPSRIIPLYGMPMAARLETAGGGGGWYLINYEGVRTLGAALANEAWHAIILDESTAIRNPRAKVTKTLVNQYQHVPCRAILTGDPRPESELDYFCQFQFLLGHFMSFGNYWAFRARKFRQSPHLTWEWIPTPGLRDEIKTFVHGHAVVMTKKQAGMFEQRIFEKRVVEPNDAQRAAMKQLITTFSYEYIETNFATVRDVWLARIAGGFSPDRDNPELISNAKTQELIDLMKGELKHEKVVVWFRFNEELKHVVQQLKKARITAVGVSGETKQHERIVLREQFARRNGVQVLCVQERLGRFGWDLSAADTAIYYSNHLDWESRSQSLERIAHPTKRKPLLYLDLVTRGSIDEEVVQLLREKRINSAAFMRELNTQVLTRLMKEYGRENQSQEKTAARSTDGQGRQILTAKVRRVYPGGGAVHPR